MRLAVRFSCPRGSAFGWLAALAPALLVACSASSTSRFDVSSAGTGANGTGASGTGASAGTGATGSAAQGAGGGLVIDAGSDAAIQGAAEVFGQTATTLYKLDPKTNAISVVGDFQGCDTVIDLALDKDSNMYVTTYSAFYAVDRTTAVCTHIADGSYPNSLSFVPKGTLDPYIEALVGYNGADYVRIDPTTGRVITVASPALMGGYQSSGDIVSVIGGGTYLTVKGNGCSDCIIEVDPTTGAMKRMIGALGHMNVFGLAYWGGSAYGFDDTGHVFQINLTTGAATNIPVPNAPPGLSWYGAGSTTSAPLTPTM